MRTIRLFISSIILVFAVPSIAFAQSANITEIQKNHFNETVQQVQKTESADDKRMILNQSFAKMIIAIDRIESLANLSEDEIAQLHSYKSGIVEKQNELNGLDGFDEVLDEDLDDFSDYSQQFIEQANKTITIGLGTAVLILIIILLLL